MRLFPHPLTPESDLTPEALNPCLCSFGGSSKSSTTQTTEVRDERVAATGGGIAARGSVTVHAPTTIEEVTPEIVDSALRELTGLSKLSIEEAFAFADDRAGGSEQVQKEALRIVDTVLEREQEPGVASARNALLATVAVVGLAVAAPAIFKR